MTPDYIAQVRALVDDGLAIGPHAGEQLLAEIERLAGVIAHMQPVVDAAVASHGGHEKWTNKACSLCVAVDAYRKGGSDGADE